MSSIKFFFIAFCLFFTSLSPAHAVGWEGNYVVKVVQAGNDGRIFLKLSLPGSSTIISEPFYSDSTLSRSVTQDMLTVLLSALNSGKQVKIYVNNYFRNTDGVNWRIFSIVQVGTGNF